MPMNQWNASWLTLNSQRRYPLAVDATAVDTTGSFTLPDDFLVELELPVHAGTDVDPSRFFVRNVGAFASGYSVVIGYQPIDTDLAAIDVASAVIPTSGFSRNRVYMLGGIEPFDDSLGKVVVGNLDAVSMQPAGFWTFDLEGGRLDPDAIRLMLRGVSSLIVVDGTQNSVRLQGDVELIAGTNCRIDVITADGQDAQVTINFIGGEGTSTPCDCSGVLPTAVPITSILGAMPTVDGRFTVLGSDCVGVEAIEHGVRIVDLCSKPCCGCPELERITEDLARLTQERLTTQEFVSRLQVAVDTMNQIVLGARLADRGCVQ